MKIKKKKLFIPFVLILIIVNLLLVMPEALKERIYPYSGAIFAANGAFFLSVFHDFTNFISSPMNWVVDYYEQYPALWIRRHPPLLGVVESAMFAMFGISFVTAKMTIFASSLFWGLGWFFALAKMFKDELLAFATTLLILTFPMTIGLETSVRADIPSLAFLLWGCYTFACYLESSRETYVYAVLTAILLACSLYTYQLTLFAVIAIFLYAMTQKSGFYKSPGFYTCVILFSLLMLPLVIYDVTIALQTVKGIVSGNISKTFADYAPIRSRWSFENWLHYLTVSFKVFPLAAVGLVLWGVTRRRFSLLKYEMFFFLWIILGYIGFSIIPSKNPRYVYHFIIAALPLTVIGVRDSVKMLAQKRISEKATARITTLLMIALVFWNIAGISNAKALYVQGVDKAVQAVLSEDTSAKILYHGTFESPFVFYLRKYDSDRQARVFRTTNEFNDSEKILEDLSKYHVNFVVIESENFRETHKEGLYSSFYSALNELIREEKETFQHFGDFKTLFGKPNKEKVVYIKIYKVI